MARPKKELDRNVQEIMDGIVAPLADAYLHPTDNMDSNGHARITDLCSQFHLSNLKVKKLLVTAGAYQGTRLTKVNGKYVEVAKEVMRLYEIGKTETEIMEELKISRSTVNSLLPYTANGAYNLDMRLDGSSDMSKASLASKRNKRYRKKKSVEAYRRKQLELEAQSAEKTDIGLLTNKLLEENNMNKCACCGKETLHLVRVGNNSDIGMCCDFCASVIMMELKKRKYKRTEKECKADVLYTDDVYIDNEGLKVPKEALKFQVLDNVGTTHTFGISYYDASARSYEAYEIYKVGKSGKKLKSQPNTQYYFKVYGQVENEALLMDELIKKTAQGVKYNSIEKDDLLGYTTQLVRNNKRYLAAETGMVDIDYGHFKIDGETFNGDEVLNLFSAYEGFRVHYQVMDATDPVLEKDTYLMPVVLNDKALLDELEEVISVFSESGRGEFVSYKNVPGFDTYFCKLLGKLSFYHEHNPRGVGKIAGIKMIKRLRKVETDDDMFPEYQIRQIQDVISTGEWDNHPDVG